MSLGSPEVLARLLAHEGWPRRYPLAQPPNALAGTAFAAALLARGLDGRPRERVRTVARVAHGAWALDELVRGVNLFRRLLGAAILARLAASTARRRAAAP